VTTTFSGSATQVEIQHNDAPAPHSDILGLQVEMNASLAVQVVEHRTDLHAEPERVRRREMALLVQELAERRSLGVFEYDKGSGPIESDIEQSLHARMYQPVDPRRLTSKRFPGAGPYLGRPRELDGDGHPRPQREGQPGLAPPPVAEQRPCP
jgi:hypothetical protein